MPIHLGHNRQAIQAIELTRLKHHIVLPHLNKLFCNNKLQQLKNNHKIQVEYCSLNHDDYVALQNIINHCHELLILELHSNHIDAGHAHDLFQAFSATHLETLSFTDNWIGEKISNDFFEPLNSQHELKHLDFSLNWLRDKGIIKLVESIDLGLEKLQLSCNDFHAEGMMAISAFVTRSPQLAELDVSYNCLDARSAQYIGDIITNSTSIESLKVNSNALGDEGAAIIAAALEQTTKPISLDLSDNGITEVGAKRLIESMAVDGVVRQLNLKNNSINKEEFSQSYPLRGEERRLKEVYF